MQLESHKKITVEQIIAAKNKSKIICLTAYTFPIAKILDPHCDIILVGDSLGMCVYGMKDTVEVSLDMMIAHGKAVTKACKHALVVVDLPYGTCDDSKEQALANAQKVIEETGCNAIKIETTLALIPTIKFLVERKIPVMAHVGLLPQQVRKIGGYKYQGRDKKSADEILETAKAAAAAGAFSMVIEAVPQTLADAITRVVNVPTIGIGASANCDGQVLVIDDLLGLNTEFKPKFVKNYAELAGDIDTAVKNFVSEVKAKKFPGANNLV